MIKCAQCGYENDDHNLFCSYCNFGLNNVRRKPAAAEPPAEAPGKAAAEATEAPAAETIEEKVPEQSQLESPETEKPPQADAGGTSKKKPKKPAAKRKASAGSKRTLRKTTAEKSDEKKETAAPEAKSRTPRKRRKTSTRKKSTAKRNGKLSTEEETPTIEKTADITPEVSDSPQNGAVHAAEKTAEEAKIPIPLGPATIPAPGADMPAPQIQAKQPQLEEVILKREPAVPETASPKPDFPNGQPEREIIEAPDSIPIFRKPTPEPVAPPVKETPPTVKEAPVKQPHKTVTPFPQQPNVFPWKVAAIIAACGFFAVCAAFFFFGSPAAEVDPQEIYLEAERLYDEKDMTAALIKYSMVVEQFPQSSLAPFASRRISELKGKMFPTEVEKMEIDIQSEQLFESVEAAFEKGHISAPENDNVLFYLQKIREVNPGSVALVTWEDRVVAHLKQLANIAYESNQYITSINYFNTVLSIHPDDRLAQKKIERLYKLINIRSQRIDSKTRVHTEKPTYKEFALMDDPKPEKPSVPTEETAGLDFEEDIPEDVPVESPRPAQKEQSPAANLGNDITGFVLPVSNFKEISAKRVAEAIVTYAAYERNIAQQTDGVSIFVIGAPDVADKLQKYIGDQIGGNTLKSVLEGASLPGVVPDIVFVGDPAAAREVIQYTRRNKILSIAGKPAIIAQGITLGIGASKKKKVEILLNLTAALSEGLDWDPQVMGIAQMF